MKTILACFFTLMIFELPAQSLSPEVLATSGNSVNNSTVQVDWTIGQIATHTIDDPEFLFTQGFEQPMLMVTSIEIPSIFEGVKVYPNPTEGEIWIEFPENTSGSTEIIITDLIGRTIYKQILPVGEILKQLDVSSLSSAMYTLKLCNPKTQSSAVYKIIKIN